MPAYYADSAEYSRKPKMAPKKEYEPEPYDEEEDYAEEHKRVKKPCFYEFEVPFKVLVKVVPDCDKKKHPYDKRPL